MLIDTSDPAIREMFASESTAEKERLNKLFRSLSIDTIDVVTNQSYIEPIVNFFKRRASRY